MAISAAQVKELRERTGAGMMECKKALVENEGDIDGAIEAMRKSGAAKADKKAGRVAAEGVVVIEKSPDGNQVAIVEINAETDFVAKQESFSQFTVDVARRVLSDNPSSLDALAVMPITEGGATIEDTRQELVGKIGENISVRRFVRLESSGNTFGVYQHGARIGVIVTLQGGDDTLAKDIAMHIAAIKPICVSETDIPADVLSREREIFVAQAAESGKPENIIEKMVDGKVKKFIKEVTLLGQSFVKDSDMTVEKLLSNKGARVTDFIRMEVGEGIEKKSENFADEVMAQAKGE
ncbi:MAG: translation elongation factor Ts [Gammaproteobacteria bacterium]|nr:MAG: translation elongation factor Ts [Gammaproteobacteria bacterium]